jgi:hypothetical protein
MITGIYQQLCLKCLGVSAVVYLVEDPKCVLGIVQLEPTPFGSATAYALGSPSYALLVRFTQGHLDPNLGGSVQPLSLGHSRAHDDYWYIGAFGYEQSFPGFASAHVAHVQRSSCAMD